MTERDAAEKVVRTSPRHLSMAPKPSGMQLAINRGKPKVGALVGPTQYGLTTEAFNLVHPQGPAHPDFYDSSDKAFIDSYIRIWNFVDYFKNRPGPNTVGTPDAPLRSLGVPFGEGAGDDHLWPVLSDEGCKMSYIDVNGNSDGELLARFGAARPSQGWASNRYHLGTDVIARGGDIVIAPEDAVVGSINDFYAGTEALLLHLENGNTLILGEINPNSYDEFGIKAGDTVLRGQPVARVGTFSSGQQLDYDMLHVELWKGHRSGSGNWYDGSPPPVDVLNPALYLVKAACSA